MKKLFYLIILIVLIFITRAANVNAQELSAGPSAALLKPVVKQPDSRVIILREFLEQYNSPLVPFASDFVEIADKYELDWRLVAAISGVESTFGREIPSESFNGWGWGIYGDNVIRFSSWKEGVETVSQGLKINYVDKLGTNDVFEIGRLYAASPTWAQRVTYFMNKIEEYKDLNLANNLSISL